MSKIAITPNASGTGTFTIAAPNSNTDRTLTLPDAAGAVVIDEAGGGSVKIDSSGNVGIGTSSPQKSLVVSDGGAMGIELSPDDAGQGYSRILNFDRTTSQYEPLYIEGEDLRFSTGTSAVERMRIDTSGRVTTPFQPKFSVNGNTSQWLVLGSSSVWYVITNAVGVNNSTGIIGANLGTNNYGSVAGSGFNASTGRFTAPVAGMYMFMLSMYMYKLGSGTQFVHINSLYNGGIQNDYTVFGNLDGGPGYIDGVKFTWLIYMQANDTWAPAIFSNSANAYQIYGDYIRISGYLLG